jgi:hypothetical protein
VLVEETRSRVVDERVAELIGEVGHILVPNVGGQRIDADQSSSSRSTGVRPLIPVSDAQYATSPVFGLIARLARTAIHGTRLPVE